MATCTNVPSTADTSKSSFEWPKSPAALAGTASSPTYRRATTRAAPAFSQTGKEQRAGASKGLKLCQGRTPDMRKNFCPARGVSYGNGLPRGRWWRHHCGRGSGEAWPSAPGCGLLAMVAMGHIQVGLHLTQLLEASTFSDSVTSQPLGTAWWLATAPNGSCAPEPGQTSVRRDVWSLRGDSSSHRAPWPALAAPA